MIGQDRAAVTDPSLSWIKLLFSSWGSSSGAMWDQLPVLSSLLSLRERLLRSPAASPAALSLSLLHGESKPKGHPPHQAQAAVTDCVDEGQV